ncbi:vitamin K epoxide reductase family protein [uncultured Dokdonia sp.]|uniref:vitamin K epoxide reductase family protein n=1 Tax=uncultured Dokdonia sp. TaxID=575653 RepID=UPI00260CDECC|nr:vitamin K epoxide reductase family protein [uncultured Dokdonia sp.]
MNNSVIYQVAQLLKLNKIAFDKEELAFQIQSHPSYPSLHAITGVLTHFNIDHLALVVPATEEILDQLPTVFLSCMKIEEDQLFGIVVKKENSLITYYSAKDRKEYATQEFLQHFTGIIVAVEKEETDRPSVKNKKTTYLRTGLFAGLGFMLLGLIYQAQFTTGTIGYGIVALLGVFISVAIIKQQLGIETKIGNAFCSDTNTSKNCSTVLSSDGATVFGIKLSDVSLLYFIGLSCSVVVLSICKYAITPLYIVSFIATPITLYSIYYQYAFAKAWCPLCLVIVGILLTQTGIGISQISDIVQINALLIIGIVYTLTLLTWMFIEPIFLASKKLKKATIDFTKFKRNFTLFETLLTQAPKKQTSIDNASEIVFGNVNAPLSLVIVTSPFCGHCKPVHSILEDILKKYSDLVAITIRINVNTDDRETTIYKITSRLLEIYHREGQEPCLKAMHDIYGGMNPDAWLSTWGTCKQEDAYHQTLIHQQNWSAYHGINFTPEILINGYSFPSAYAREDLTYFIEELHEASLKAQIPFSSQFQEAI